MDEHEQHGNAVTQAFSAPGASRADQQSQRLADVTRAYRSALADDAAEVESQPTIQYGEPARPAAAGDGPSDSYGDADDSEVEELLLNADRAELADSPSPGDSSEQGMADDAEELASYMKSFMQRMKCKSDEPEVEAAPPPKEAPRQQPQRQYSGPKSAPEQQSDLQRMREVANANVRTSLSHHAARICQRTRHWLVVSLVCCLLAAALAYISPAAASYGYIASVVVFGGAAVAAYRYHLGLKKLGPESSRSERPPAAA